jgi:Cu+-exporting ATPase
MGIEVLILSGDNQSSVGDVAKDLGISNFKAGLSPEDKLAEIRSLQQEGKKVAMVGDGINDAPALGIADVGFAMGEGTDIAIESADIAIVGNQLNKVVSAIRISKRTIRNIYQNLFGAFVYNIILIPIAAGVLYPILISPTFAGMAMAMSSVTVVANASRLRFIAL